MPFPRALEQIRTIGIRTLSDTATITRKTQVRDTTGGFTDTYVSVGTTPCRLSGYLVRPREYEYQPRIYGLAYWTVTVPFDVEILNTDRLIVGTRTLEVVNSGIGTLDVLQVLVCQEIQ